MAAKFWEYLPEQTYRDWQANDFVQEQVNRINEVESSLDEIIPSEPFIGEVPEQVSGQIIEGAPFGGVFGKIKDKLKPRNPLTKTAETFEDIWGVSTDAVTSALDWEQENIAEPFSGYFQAVGGLKTPIDLATGNPLAAIERSRERYWENPNRPNLTDYKGHGDLFEKAKKEDISGFEAFGTEVVADPTTYIGGYGKAVSKVPGLVKAGKALTAIEGAPGKAVGKALSKTSETAKSVPWLNKLLEPSTNALARQEGDRAAEAVRVLADDYSPGGFTTPDPAFGRDLRNAIKSGTTAVPPQFLDDWNVLKDLKLKGNTPAELFASAKEGATTGYRSMVDEAVQAERMQRSGLGWLAGQAQNAGDKVVGAISRPTRALATAALGTVGYPLGVGVEDVARSALAGHAGTMQADEAAESLKGVRGMPSWMFQRTGDTSASASLGGNPKHMGPKVGVGSKEFYPGDVLSGKAFRDKAGQISEPIRRDFVAKEYKAAFDDLVARGTSPDQAAVEAAQSAVKRMEQVFPGFAPESKLDAGMQSVVPFWRYQSSHTPYLARTFAERPGLAPTYDKYLEGTDGGNIRIPGGPLGDDISINPLAGSTYNRINQMSKPDFPPYTSGLSGDIEQGLDKLGRTTGLYPGLPVELAQLGVRASEGQPLQLGELIPSPALAPAQATAALGTIPGLGNAPGIEQLSDLGAGISNMAPDRFRDYAVALQLAANGVSPDEATPQQTEDARKQVALQQFAQTETNVARFRPPEKAQYDDAVKQAALDAGIPKDVVDKAIGDPLGAINPDTGQPYLNTVQKRAIYEANPEWENWRQASTPLKSPADQQRIGSTRAYYKKLDAISADTETQLATYAQAVKEGRMSGADYRNARGDVMSKAAARREQAKADHPEAQITKPDELGSVRPEDYAAQQYYDIQAQRGTDGQLDFDTFTKQREGVLAGMDEATRNYVLNEYRRKFSNPDVQAMEDRFKGVQGKYQEYLKIPKYTGLDPEITAAVEDASRQLRALTAVGMPYKLALGQLLDAGHPGAALVKATSKLVNPARKQYLAANPDLIWMLHDVLGPTIEAAGIGLN